MKNPEGQPAFLEEWLKELELKLLGYTADRRSFLKWSLAFSAGAFLAACGGSSGGGKKITSAQKLIFISIDSLHPRYLTLDAAGSGPGSEGNWLLPNIRKFLDQSVHYPQARCFLPSATDMNQLNVLAGSSSAQTGILGVWSQPTGWDKDGNVILSTSDLAYARDDKGRPVDTLFHAWKRAWPESKTVMISGKEWVANMFKSQNIVDILISGGQYPDYISAPPVQSLGDPPTDTDAACDPESPAQGLLGLEGQKGVLNQTMEGHPENFPHDAWVVDTALTVFEREDPGLAYILLAETDDAGHCQGVAWDPSEFTAKNPPDTPPAGCTDSPDYQLVSKRNPLIYREGPLDLIRNTDIQFGRLIDGLENQGVLDQAAVIVFSDHSMMNHLYQTDWGATDFQKLVFDGGLGEKSDLAAFTVCSFGYLYWRYAKTSQVNAAKELLLKYRLTNPETGATECPWWVLNREDMKNGIEGVARPGELYHKYFVEGEGKNSLIWPDLMILSKNGWQLPIYSGRLPKLGMTVPDNTPPFLLWTGGHGSVDTLDIVAAISLPGGKTGTIDREIRIADLGVTAARLFGLKLKSTTIGADLSSNLI